MVIFVAGLSAAHDWLLGGRFRLLSLRHEILVLVAGLSAAHGWLLGGRC